MTSQFSVEESPPVSRESRSSTFDGLISRGLISGEKLADTLKEATDSGVFPETLLINQGLPKHELLRCLVDRYRLPFKEFSESITLTEELAGRLDLEHLKTRRWFPLSAGDDAAEVMVCDPEDPSLDQEIRVTLGVRQLSKFVAFPADLVRLIEHHQDANPNFPASSGRTNLALVRNSLARLRTVLAFHRTSLAKGRTGLAMLRTGVSFNAVALVMLQVFGVGYLSLPGLALVIIGLGLAISGLLWYLPIRRVAGQMPVYRATESTFGTTFLEQADADGQPAFTRQGPIDGAEELRLGWNRLSPVMKRRFLANDRTDFAEERTILSAYRTAMGRARTGLAFTRTGMSLTGIGIALFRQFPLSGWVVFHGALIVVGTIMTLEGFHWYVPGRLAGNAGLRLIKQRQQKTSIWEFMFSPFRSHLSAGELPTTLFIKESHSPGIWGTTGLALERTLIAERRNVKARFRTILARSRTGMAFIRTGTKIFSVGLGLLLYFGTANLYWMAFNAAAIILGLILILDGFSWHKPAEKSRNEFPYCFADMEIPFPDYSKPTLSWKKVVFSHYDL